MTFLLRAAATGLFEDRMCGIPSQSTTQQDHCAFGEDCAARCGDVFLHAFSVNGQTLRNFRHGRGRESGSLHYSTYGRPLCLPAAHAALILLNHPRQETRHQAWQPIGGRQRQCASDGIAFVRHGGRSTAAFAACFRDLANFVLHQQAHVASHLA
jgi:hypothetical protein